jgi:hypothetical protein
MEGWKKFNRAVDKNKEMIKRCSYEEFEEAIKDTLTNTIGRKTITTGSKRGKES